MAEPFEGGIRPHRIEYVRESTEGTTPSNPSWLKFSDTVTAWPDWEPDANTTEQRGHGDPDAQGYFNGAETHELTVSYDLGQWLVDSSDNAQDAAADAMLLDTDNSINNTHSIVMRQDFSTGGVDSAGRRIYHVYKGAHPASVTLPFETEDGSPVSVELSYQAEKGRTYVIDQPADGTTITVSSSDSGDTSQSVTIENEGATTTETLTLNGTTAVTGTTSFSDIDSVELSAETAGDITIEDDSNNTLMTIYGQNTYEQGEGDLGVPNLGTGSHSSANINSWVSFVDDSMLTFGGSDIAAEFISGELNVDLNLEDNSRSGSLTRNIHVTGRTVEWSATVAGEQESIDQVIRHLHGTQNDIVWTDSANSGNTVTGTNARYMSPGSSSFEPQQGKHERDVTLESEGISLAGA